MNTELENLKNLPEYEFNKLECPCLFIHGKNDGDVSVNHAEFACNRIPNCTLISLEDTDHLLWLSPHYKKAKNDLISFISKYPSCTDDSIKEELMFSSKEIPFTTISDSESISASPLAMKLHNSQINKAMARLEKDEEDFYDL